MAKVAEKEIQDVSGDGGSDVMDLDLFWQEYEDSYIW